MAKINSRPQFSAHHRLRWSGLTHTQRNTCWWSAAQFPPPAPASRGGGAQQHCHCSLGPVESLDVAGRNRMGQSRKLVASLLLCVQVALGLVLGRRLCKTPLETPLARCRSSRTPSLFFCGTTWKYKDEEGELFRKIITWL